MIEELTILWSLGSTCICIHVHTPHMHYTDMRIVHVTQMPKNKEEEDSETTHFIFCLHSVIYTTNIW